MSEPKVFLTHHESEDYSDAKCGCILERRLDGEGSNFRMCEMHYAAKEMLKELCWMFSYVPKASLSEPRWKKLESLIAKASGKTHKG